MVKDQDRDQFFLYGSGFRLQNKRGDEKKKTRKKEKANIRVISDLSELKYLEMMHIKCNKLSFKYLHIHR